MVKIWYYEFTKEYLEKTFYLGFFFKVLLSHSINYQSDIYQVWKKNSSFKDIWGLPINNIFMHQSEQAIVVKY